MKTTFYKSRIKNTRSFAHLSISSVTVVATPLFSISENISTAKAFISSIVWGPTSDKAW